MKLSNKMIAQLEGLTNTLYDSQYIYQTCAQQVKDLELKSWLNDLGNQRNAMGVEIEGFLSTFNQILVKQRSLQSLVQQLWINVKCTVMEPNKEHVLSDVQRSEYASIGIYYDILIEPDISRILRSLLAQQLEEIQVELQALSKSVHQVPSEQVSGH